MEEVTICWLTFIDRVESVFAKTCNNTMIDATNVERIRRSIVGSSTSISSSILFNSSFSSILLEWILLSLLFTFVANYMRNQDTFLMYFTTDLSYWLYTTGLSSLFQLWSEAYTQCCSALTVLDKKFPFFRHKENDELNQRLFV